MAAELVWLEQAEADLDSVGEHIAQSNPGAAAKYVDSILSACKKLTEFPRSGRQYNKRYRILVVRNHLVFYRHDKTRERVVIAAVFDGRRNLARLVKSLLGRENLRRH